MAHGASIVTVDTDICFRQPLENCERLAQSLETLGAEIFPTRPIPILNFEQLIQAKAALDQPEDREPLDQLLAIRKLRGQG